ncbi:sensor histidine kinase [Streptomyces sp. NPDC048603]|uniref:sensor histidine kinase n=1 Tax=Streptomyces sp. NPDC048603 TaxID=3365577 RepID=UPI0037169636
MKETTAGGTRSPEFELASGLFTGLSRSLREALFTGAFAYRPLPELQEDGALARRLPARIRSRAAQLPHLLVLAAAGFVVFVSANVDRGYQNFTEALVLGVIAAVPVLLTLSRPVGAFWCSMLVTSVLALVAGTAVVWPWTPASFLGHLATMVIVAVRTGPRAAAWMWVCTVALGMASAVFAGYGEAFNLGPMVFLSGVAMLAVSVWQIQRKASQEIAAQQEVTAVERDKRTLLEERTTIARELHDVVAHHMSVVAIQAEAAPYRVENPPPELEAAFATIRENAVAALTELRRVLGVVRSKDYEAPEAPQPTLASLDGLLANVREAGLDVEKTVTGAARELPQGVELSAYRIIQEALSNTLRHAPGARAGVEVSYVLGGLGIRVVNEPPTGDARPSPGAGHGIAGMRERVAMLEGEMTTGKTAEGGYEVAVFIPVRSTSAEDAA